jgi:hypothetical protein
MYADYVSDFRQRVACKYDQIVQKKTSGSRFTGDVTEDMRPDR